jgi:hypothetical protein
MVGMRSQSRIIGFATSIICTHGNDLLNLTRVWSPCRSKAGRSPLLSGPEPHTPGRSPAPHGCSLQRATIRDQLSCSSAERAHLLLDSPVPADDQPSGHCGLMYVQPTFTFDESWHNASIGGDCCAAGLVQTVMRPSRFASATKGGTFTGAGQSYRRDLCHLIDYRPFKQSPTTDACITD